MQAALVASAVMTLLRTRVQTAAIFLTVAATAAVVAVGVGGQCSIRGAPLGGQLLQRLGMAVMAALSLIVVVVLLLVTGLRGLLPMMQQRLPLAQLLLSAVVLQAQVQTVEKLKQQAHDQQLLPLLLLLRDTSGVPPQSVQPL